MRKKKQNGVSVTFALWLALLNGLIYFLGAIGVFEILFAGSFGRIVFKAVFVGVDAIMLGLICLPYHLLFYLTLKWITRRKCIYVILFLLPGVLFGVKAFYRSLPEVKTQRILEGSGLASLPESASKIRTYSWSTMFSGETFLRFKASKNDIEGFLNGSAILKDAECRIFLPDRMRLKRPDEHEYDREYGDGIHEYFRPHALAPVWYGQEIRSPGRLYEFRSDFGHGAEVIIHDEQNVVLVYVSFD